MRACLFALLCACGTAAAPAPIQTPAAPADPWPAQPDWVTETIPFPLGFAPDIELQGVELLRFAPAFYDTSQPGYFTYAFVWIVEPPAVPVDAAWISTQLGRYFDGLCRATADEMVAGCDATPTRVELVATEARAFALADTTAWRVTLTTFDGFEANQPVTLDGTLEVGRCGSKLVLSAALAPASGALGTALRAQAQAFACPS